MVFQLIFIGIVACQSFQPIEPISTQQQLQEAWQTNQHAVWEVDWPTTPIGGTVVVEYWRFDNQYRFEILEATSARLVGETLVSDGDLTWRYNRLKLDKTNLTETMSPARLSPVTDMFSLIEKRLNQSASISAQQQITSTLSETSETIELIFADQTRLIFWLGLKTRLPLRIKLITSQETISLKAQSNESLTHPLQGLFGKPND
ncbi:hypothetical protein QUF63_00200 [Anaerolineales bacterium HSG25]|nr:hypothetical protein [Anaerolineales bacterium HSG25]